jgi:hypothetical protein
MNQSTHSCRNNNYNDKKWLCKRKEDIPITPNDESINPLVQEQQLQRQEVALQKKGRLKLVFAVAYTHPQSQLW